MPLNSDKLKKEIEKKLTDSIASYNISEDDKDIDVSIIVDPLLDHLHDEIDSKLTEIIKAIESLNTAVTAGMNAIVPPGTGSAGAGAYSAQMQQVIAKLAKIKQDIKGYK